MESQLQSQRLEHWLSNVLRIGIWISVLCMAAGLIELFLFPSTMNTMRYQTLTQLITLIIQSPLSPASLLLIGITILCFTPILRVATACIAFAMEQDWRFVTISLIVLMLLISEIFYALNIL
ncbi:MAG TPA: DUF1634 domain-containing protein [Bacteroidota bacterium]|nr:DUF1634 domain-containing protein [Bacteroidota bacterium]